MGIESLKQKCSTTDWFLFLKARYESCSSKWVV